MNIETNITKILCECRDKAPAETYKILAREIIREVIDKHLINLLIQREKNQNTHESSGYRDALDEELAQVDDIKSYILFGTNRI